MRTARISADKVERVRRALEATASTVAEGITIRLYEEIHGRWKALVEYVDGTAEFVEGPV